MEWRKSSRSNDSGGNCVEVATLSDHVLIRDSKAPKGGTLAVSPAEWRAFLDSVR
jgi:hypothetical protein